MAVVMFIAAIVCAWNGTWWLATLLAVTAIACAADTTERERAKRAQAERRRRRQSEKP